MFYLTAGVRAVLIFRHSSDICGVKRKANCLQQWINVNVQSLNISIYYKLWYLQLVVQATTYHIRLPIPGPLYPPFIDQYFKRGKVCLGICLSTLLSKCPNQKSFKLHCCFHIISLVFENMK